MPAPSAPAPVPAAIITLGSSSPAPAPAPAAVIAVGSSSPPAPQGNSQGAQKGKETLRKKRMISGPKTTEAQPKKASKKAPAQKKPKKLSGKYVLLIFLSLKLPLVHPLRDVCYREWLDGKNGQDDGTFDAHWNGMKRAQKQVYPLRILFILSYLTSMETSTALCGPRERTCMHHLFR